MLKMERQGLDIQSLGNLMNLKKHLLIYRMNDMLEKHDDMMIKVDNNQMYEIMVDLLFLLLDGYL